MPNIAVSLAGTHFLNIIGVACNFYLSRTFLKRLVRESDRMQAHLKQLQHQVNDMRQQEVVMGMISLRMFPGSPNPLYNLIFPHIPAISLSQNLLGVLIGQLPYNLCVVKAGQVICKMQNRSEIIDTQTTLEMLAVSLLLMSPIIYSHAWGSSRKNSDKRKSPLDMSTTAASGFFDNLSTSGDDLESLLNDFE